MPATLRNALRRFATLPSIWPSCKGILALLDTFSVFDGRINHFCTDQVRGFRLCSHFTPTITTDCNKKYAGTRKCYYHKCCELCCHAQTLNRFPLNACLQGKVGKQSPTLLPSAFRFQAGIVSLFIFLIPTPLFLAYKSIQALSLYYFSA